MRTRVFLALLLALGTLTASAGPLLAAGDVDQQQLDVSFARGFGWLPVAQTFTAGKTGVLDAVAIYPYYFVSGFNVSITTTDQGVPTTTVLASATIHSSAYGTWVTTTFDQPTAVVAGTQYALVVNPPPATGSYLCGAASFTDPYPGGTLVLFRDNKWLPYEADLGFVTYVTPASYQPDGWIRKGLRPYAGRDVYNSDADQQTRLATPPPEKPVRFRIAVQNDGNVRDAFIVTATGVAEPGYSIRFYHAGREITAAVVSGTWVSPMLAAGDKCVIKAVVRATGGAAATVSRLITIASANDPTKVDAVQFVVQPRF